MKPKRLKQEEIDRLKKMALELHKLGYTTRDISDMIKNVRTHAWVAKVVKESYPLDKDLTENIMEV